MAERRALTGHARLDRASRVGARREGGLKPAPTNDGRGDWSIPPHARESDGVCRGPFLPYVIIPSTSSACTEW